MNVDSLTRKERDRQLRKTDLLSAAEHLFALKGYDRATMQDIAREAQYATGTAYLYFKDKESLYFSLLEEKISEMMSIIKEKTSAVKDVREKLNILIYESLVFFEHDQDFFHIFISETSKFRWVIDNKINASESMLKQMSHLADIIREAQQKKMIRSDFKAEHVADIFTAILSTVIVGLLKEKPSRFGELKSISDYIFSLFMNGVRA
jgi:AcrR family transcriptional regulator